MVKNRNWQVRVEAAEQRRRETRQRKAKSEEKKAFKALVQKFLEHLDQRLTPNLTGNASDGDDELPKDTTCLHLWVDSPTILQAVTPNTPRKHKKPTKHKEQDQLWETDETGENCESPVQSPRQSRRARSSSIESEGSCKKKAHPRSKHDGNNNNVSMHHHSSAVAGLPLCRAQFLRGHCGTAKKGGCRFFHYKSSYRTLQSVVSDRATLEAVEQALPSAAASMDMLYYVPIIARRHATQAWSEAITEHLMKTQTPLASIVYAATTTTTSQSQLVFDRHQGGSLLVFPAQRPREASWGSETSDETVSTWAGSSTSSLGHHPRSRSFDGEQLETSSCTELKDLPDTLWEHILSFLPESAVASCALVCRAWNRGPHSPHFWRQWCERRRWEIPDIMEHEHDNVDHDNVNHDNMNPERRLFAQHFTVVRDVESLAAAVPSIVSSTPSGSNPQNRKEQEVAYQAFGLREYAPRDACVGVESWAPLQVLAAYQECSLRLFQATATRSHTRCKELVCVNIDPYKLTKKRNCTMDAMTMDDTLIACLCHVEAGDLGRHHRLPDDNASDLMSASSIIVVLNREDFLMGENSAVTAKLGGNNARQDLVTDKLQVIDVGEAVLNYILSMDEVDHRLLPLFDLLASGEGTLADVAINVSRGSIVACGLGRFMVEVSVCIPNNIDDLEDLDSEMIQLDRKLLLISSTANAVLWMGNSYVDGPFSTLPAAAVPAVLSRCYKRHRGSSSVVVGSLLSPSLSICDMAKDGFVHPPRAIANARHIRSQLLSSQRQMDYQQFPSRSLLLTGWGVIAKDTISRSIDGMEKIQSSVSLFPLNKQLPSSGKMNLVVEGHVNIHEMVCLRDDYALLLCSEFSRQTRPSAIDDEENEDLETLGGQWFGEIDEEPPSDQSSNRSEHRDHANPSKQCVIVIVYIPTLQEIGRVPLHTNLDYKCLEPRMMATSSDTVALALGNMGIAIGGQDVRHLEMSLEEQADFLFRQERKKKASRAKGRSKKDRFVRGMSTRA